MRGDGRWRFGSSARCVGFVTGSTMSNEALRPIDIARLGDVRFAGMSVATSPSATAPVVTLIASLSHTLMH